MYFKLSQNIVLYAFTLLLLCAQGCVPENCTSVKCENKGVCVNGTCACPYGYEGQFCEQRWYEKFTGNWAAKETNKAGTILQQYDITNVTYRNTDSFLVAGFRNNGDTVVCILKAFEKFSMLSKKFPDGDSIISGEGTLLEAGTKVTGLYSLYKDSATINVNFIWTK